MSLNTILCHPEAESLTGLETADAYLARHPDFATWRNLGGGDAAVRTAMAEGFLAAASRMISRAPLAFGPLANDFGWGEQGLRIPAAGHPVLFGVIEDFVERGFTDARLLKQPRQCVLQGAIRFEEGKIVAVADFDPATGAVTVADLPDEEVEHGSPYALIESLPLPVIHAVCEQAVYLAGCPNLSALNEGERGIRITTATGMGGGSVTSEAATAAGELCFAARRLLRAAGLLRTARNLVSGRA